MYKPLIGLTPSHDTTTNDISMRPTYLQAITAAGGIPMVLPLEPEAGDLAQIVEVLDGFLFTGGPDVHPFLFGEETQIHCGNVSPKRDSLELSLLPLVMKAQKPILGICRGIQMLNIGLGGTIYQDIPSQFAPSSGNIQNASGTCKACFPLAHRQPFPHEIPSHTVTILPGTKMADICQKSAISVNSMHHQAVRDLASGCIASAVASDGLVEALEMPDYPFLVGVQWHPEYLWKQDPAAASLFQHFIEACRR
jgi:putative glutamine amidotransferase